MERNARFMETTEEQKETNSVVQSLDPFYCHLKKRFLHPALDLFRDSTLCKYLEFIFQIAITLKRENKTLASHLFHISPTKYTYRYNPEVLH